MYSFNKTIYTNNKILREKYMADDKKGMLRHVDVLGRVVIPREVRKALRINYGDLMEFCACSNQQVVMRKFHLIREIADLAISLVSLAQIGRQCDIYIMDTEKVVCKIFSSMGFSVEMSFCCCCSQFLISPIARLISLFPQCLFK